MGYIRHDAIIVTSCFEDHIKKAHDGALMFFNEVSEILPSKMNGYLSFFIPPDGSKEGWPDSEVGDRRRAKFIDWVMEYHASVGFEPPEGIIVNYGGDDSHFVGTYGLDGIAYNLVQKQGA